MTNATPDQAKAALIKKAFEIADEMAKKHENDPKEQARIMDRLRTYIEDVKRRH